ncbi:MAG: hypothetical protein DMF95_32395 [Acidobacteria bacterium]|nr:MAG: hypothetical protein DMF95_32395 [Acidobacteriota bacterium]
MRLAKLALTVLGIVSLVFGFALDGRAGGGGEGNCTVTNDNGGTAVVNGKPTIVGSGVLEMFDFNPSTGAVSGADATLTLSFKTITGIFRAHIGATSFPTPEKAGCDILAAGPTDATGATIHQVFGLDPIAQLNLCFVTDTKKPDKILCQSITFENNPVPGTPNYSAAMNKLVIFVLQ